MNTAETKCPRCSSLVTLNGDAIPEHNWPDKAGRPPTRCGASGLPLGSIGEDGRIRGDVIAHLGVG